MASYIFHNWRHFHATNLGPKQKYQDKEQHR